MSKKSWRISQDQQPQIMSVTGNTNRPAQNRGLGGKAPSIATMFHHWWLNVRPSAPKFARKSASLLYSRYTCITITDSLSGLRFLISAIFQWLLNTMAQMQQNDMPIESSTVRQSISKPLETRVVVRGDFGHGVLRPKTP